MNAPFCQFWNQISISTSGKKPNGINWRLILSIVRLSKSSFAFFNFLSIMKGLSVWPRPCLEIQFCFFVHPIHRHHTIQGGSAVTWMFSYNYCYSCCITLSKYAARKSQYWKENLFFEIKIRFMLLLLKHIFCTSYHKQL